MSNIEHEMAMDVSSEEEVVQLEPLVFETLEKDLKTIPRQIRIIDGRIKYGYCGSAIMRDALLDVAGINRSQEDLAEAMGTTPEEGTSPEKMILVAEREGLKAGLVKMDLPSVNSNRERGHNLILPVTIAPPSEIINTPNYGDERAGGLDYGHYVRALLPFFITQGNDQCIAVNDPSLEGCIAIYRVGDFEKMRWDIVKDKNGQSEIVYDQVVLIENPNPRKVEYTFGDFPTAIEVMKGAERMGWEDAACMMYVAEQFGIPDYTQEKIVNEFGLEKNDPKWGEKLLNVAAKMGLTAEYGREYTFERINKALSQGAIIKINREIKSEERDQRYIFEGMVNVDGENVILNDPWWPGSLEIFRESDFRRVWKGEALIIYPPK